MTGATVKERLLEAIKPHVPFEGWSEAAFRAAAQEAGIEMSVARAACPRGAVDLARAFHEEGDARMEARLAEADFGNMRFRDRIATAILWRLEVVEDRELVRRGMTLYAQPIHAGEGARLVWGTCDRIWTALGDTSRDINWYTKRATLSAVYSSAVLYWLGDASENMEATRAFVDRRIDDVMQIEKVKADMRENKVLSTLLAGPKRLMSRVRAPQSAARTGMPGRWSGPN